MYTFELILGIIYLAVLLFICISDIIKLRKDKLHENTCDCRHCIMDCCPHSSAHSEEYKRAITEKEKS